MGENRVCDGGEYTKLTWSNFMVESTQSWPGQKYHPCLQILWDLVIITIADCVSFTHVCLWNMCLSGLRGTSIPVKEGWTELSPESGFKIPSEFEDVFREVGPIKYFCSVIYKTIYKTSKLINMYAGCFEWERTGSVTVESTKSWLGQILCVFIF